VRPVGTASGRIRTNSNVTRTTIVGPFMTELVEAQKDAILAPREEEGIALNPEYGNVTESYLGNREVCETSANITIS
jgi:hypothetical protein